ncbi:hypothetical protein [Streptomyces sp. NBC_00286]|uniref:hypothetical protein n=1 Tax=Streptomyces sp. NBC_00286 TaxID=2975701 RepID=UPI002E27F8F9|nr:hypothetical protein [Streptomyces sp. NBC_00286]
MSRKPELRGRAARLARLIPSGSGQAARTPFVLLIVLLLGGGLIGLLVLNSALSEGAFKLDDLQDDTKSLTDEEQALQRDVDAYSAPDALQRRARELGMVPGGDPAFLNPDGTVRGIPEAAQQSSVRVPLVLAPKKPDSTPKPKSTPTPKATPTPKQSPKPPASRTASPQAQPSTPSTQPPTPPGR